MSLSSAVTPFRGYIDGRVTKFVKVLGVRNGMGWISLYAFTGRRVISDRYVVREVWREVLPSSHVARY